MYNDIKGILSNINRYNKGFRGGAGKKEKRKRKENIIILLFGFMGYGMGWRGGLYKGIKWSL